MFMFYFSRWREKLMVQLIAVQLPGRNSAGPGGQQWMLSEPSSVLFSLVPLLKKKSPSRDFFLMAKRKSPF